MEKKKIGWFEVLFWILMVMLFVMILSRIFSHSATDLNIILTFSMIILAIMSYIVKMNREIGDLRNKKIISDDYQKSKRFLKNKNSNDK